MIQNLNPSSLVIFTFTLTIRKTRVNTFEFTQFVDKKKHIRSMKWRLEIWPLTFNQSHCQIRQSRSLGFYYHQTKFKVDRSMALKLCGIYIARFMFDTSKAGSHITPTGVLWLKNHTLSVRRGSQGVVRWTCDPMLAFGQRFNSHCWRLLCCNPLWKWINWTFQSQTGGPLYTCKIPSHSSKKSRPLLPMLIDDSTPTVNASNFSGVPNFGGSKKWDSLVHCIHFFEQTFIYTFQIVH